MFCLQAQGTHKIICEPAEKNTLQGSESTEKHHGFTWNLPSLEFGVASHEGRHWGKAIQKKGSFDHWPYQSERLETLQVHILIPAGGEGKKGALWPSAGRRTTQAQVSRTEGCSASQRAVLSTERGVHGIGPPCTFRSLTFICVVLLRLASPDKISKPITKTDSSCKKTAKSVNLLVFGKQTKLEHISKAAFWHWNHSWGSGSIFCWGDKKSSPNCVRWARENERK